MASALKNVDRRTMLLALVQHHWEALERHRIIEEELSKIHLFKRHLVLARVRLSAALLKVLVELRKEEEFELVKQMTIRSEALHGSNTLQ